MKLLVVDDDEVILELIQMFLASIDYKDVHLASSGQQAIEMAASQDVPFECVLLDIAMPQMTGIECLGKLREISGYNMVPIIMLTALGDRPHIAQAFVAGAWDYIVKPFDPFDLETRIQSAKLRLNQQRSLRASDTPALQSFDRIFKRHAVLADPDGVDIQRESGVIGSDVFENCLQSLAGVSKNSICLAMMELENLPAIARKLGPAGGDEYLIVLAAHITEALGSSNAILAYQGHGVFVALSFLAADAPADDVFSMAVLQATMRTDAAFFPDKEMKARFQVGQVLFRDLPQGSEPMSMLQAAAQSMGPPVVTRLQ